MIVSNHGGRQLDGVSATLRVLPEVVKAVNGQVEILMDGGVRRGGDIVKAICLGARAVLVGRAYAYGLAAAGEAGVSQALDILRTDMERTMKLLGCASIGELDRSAMRMFRGTGRFRRVVKSLIWNFVLGGPSLVLGGHVPFN